MSVSIRDLLLKPVALPEEVVPLPELGDGVSVRVRGMNTKEKGAFEMQFVKKGETDPVKIKQMRERLIVACCIDDAGNRIFSPDDVAQLGLQSVAVIDRIVDACKRVNGDAKDAEKNSESTADA